MPTYTYKCPTCEDEIELIQSIREREIPTCEKEGCGLPMETVISASPIVFKGSCWAKDGYTKK